jgi:hypothetical protein
MRVADEPHRLASLPTHPPSRVLISVRGRAYSVLNVAMPLLCANPQSDWPRTETWFFCDPAPSRDTALDN